MRAHRRRRRARNVLPPWTSTRSLRLPSVLAWIPLFLSLPLLRFGTPTSSRQSAAQASQPCPTLRSPRPPSPSLFLPPQSPGLHSPPHPSSAASFLTLRLPVTRHPSLSLSTLRLRPGLGCPPPALLSALYPNTVWSLHSQTAALGPTVVPAAPRSPSSSTTYRTTTSSLTPFASGARSHGNALGSTTADRS